MRIFFGLEVEDTNTSIHRKHVQRHSKLYFCHEQACNREKGFSTKNDLDRHKKSVHGIRSLGTIDRSFKCAGTDCSKKEKIWPRLDNFKSHCCRMHAKEDLEELVKKQVFCLRE